MHQAASNTVADSLNALASALASLYEDSRHLSADFDFGGFVFPSDDEGDVWTYGIITPQGDANWRGGWPNWVPKILHRKDWRYRLDEAMFSVQEYAEERNLNKPDFPQPIKQTFQALFNGKAPEWMGYRKCESSEPCLCFREKYSELETAITSVEYSLRAASPEWIRAVDSLGARNWRERLLRKVIDPLKYSPSYFEDDRKPFNYPSTSRQYLELSRGLAPVKSWAKGLGELRSYIKDAEACRYVGLVQPVGGSSQTVTSARDESEDAVSLQPAQQKAWASYLLAEAKIGLGRTDRETYDWLAECDAELFVGPLADYELPSCDTWQRQLRAARKHFGGQKNQPRASRPSGGSIVLASEI
ncbi:hypothetical protein [Botrimarina hoheduenensis]|uniref:Uncharacterized protein n=1 Tax=Botrimarina hoheduenensis TaxID=2528000 RepID=A0A5C5VTR3_9BACT|nr:hypothetical protein [Botrimarina hoheduenensis]TWT41523.1 hypothetical protein Pla111_28990 [Botrimarina hoheduenensis]